VSTAQNMGRELAFLWPCTSEALSQEDSKCCHTILKGAGLHSSPMPIKNVTSAAFYSIKPAGGLNANQRSHCPRPTYYAHV